MTPISVVSLIARRDFFERLRSKAFLFSTGFTVVLVVSIVVLPAFFDGGDEPAAVAVHDDLLPALEPLVGTAGVDIELQAADAMAAELLEAGDLDAIVTNATTIEVGDGSDPTLEAALVGALAQLAFIEKSEELGLEPAALAELFADPGVTVIRPEGDTEEDGSRLAFAFMGTVLLFISIITYGQWIALGVIEEKSNRVVEVVLGAVAPKYLMAGKIIGIGALALGQLVLVGIVALGAGTLAGSFAVPEAAGTVVAVVVLWFVLGFAFYASAYAAAGSLVSRQEDAQNAVFPLTIVLVVSYAIATTALAGDSLLVQIASYLPPFAPTTMVIRMATGDAQVWEVALSLTLMIAAIVGLVRLAALIYAGGILGVGRRIRFRDALRQNGAR